MPPMVRTSLAAFPAPRIPNERARPGAPAAPDYQGDAMKELPKKDPPEVSGGMVQPPYPQVPCFPDEPQDPVGPLVPIFDYPAPPTPTA